MKHLKSALKPALAIALFAGLTQPGQARELKFSTPTPDQHIMTKTAVHIAEQVAATGGKDTIAVYPVNKLGDVPTVLSLLQSGAIEFAIIPVGDLANRDASLLGWFLPYQFETLRDAGAAAKSAPAQEMLARLDRQGIKGLGYVFPGQRHVLSTRPISSYEDFSGLKIRAFPNDIFNAWWREVGAAPTALPLPEIMPSLVTGVIDAVDADIDIVYGLQMQQQAPYLVLTNHMAFPAAVLASKRWWDGLKPAEQASFIDIIAQSQDWAIETQIAGEAALLEKLEDNGAKVSSLDDPELRAAGSKVRDEFLERDPLIRAFYEANAQ